MGGPAGVFPPARGHEPNSFGGRQERGPQRGLCPQAGGLHVAPGVSSLARPSLQGPPVGQAPPVPAPYLMARECEMSSPGPRTEASAETTELGLALCRQPSPGEAGTRSRSLSPGVAEQTLSVGMLTPWRCPAVPVNTP